MSREKRSSTNVQISFTETRKIEVDHHVHRLDVDTTSEQIGANEISAKTRAEIVKNTVAMFLTHFRVDVVATVPQFGDFLRQ